jgi:hypothetical protein
VPFSPFVLRMEGMCFRPIRLAYQPPANSIFLSEQTSHQQPASRTNSHQPNEQAVYWRHKVQCLMRAMPTEHRHHSGDELKLGTRVVITSTKQSPSLHF